MVTPALLENIHDQSEAFADWIKVLLYKKQANIFERIDFSDSSIFKEPLLFTYFNSEQPYMSLEQILWGYMQPDAQKAPLNVWVEKNSLTYLPNYGYLHFAERDSSSMQSLQWDGTQFGTYKKENLAIDTKSGIEIVKYPFLDWIHLYRYEEKVEAVEIEQAYARHSNTLLQALRFLENHYPYYYQALQLTVRKLVIYRGRPNSFATILAHGTAFLNPTEQDSLIFFLDNIVHQCGHIIYNTLTFEKERLFLVSPDTPMHQLSGEATDEHITLYGRYHGLFTQTSVNNLWSICIEQNLFDGREAHEILGRFSTYMYRFQKAIQKFEKQEHILAEEGKKWFYQFRSEYHRLYAKHQNLIESFDNSRQPYVFDFRQFCLDNPPKIPFELTS